MTISFTNNLYTKPLTWAFSIAGDFIKRMMTSQWLLRVLPCLRSHVSDWEFRMEAIFIQTRFRCRYGIGRVVTSVLIFSYLLHFFRLLQIEGEIATLRQVLGSKIRYASELKKKLGITPLQEMKHDFELGLKSIKDSQT